MDTTMNEDYIEEEHIGKHIIGEFFTRTWLNLKHYGHRVWVNKQDRHLPPDLDNADLQAADNTTEPDKIQPPPGLDPAQPAQPPPTYTYIYPTQKQQLSCNSQTTTNPHIDGKGNNHWQSLHSSTTSR
eukprot:2806402-Amphidinium_carterae.2